MPDLIPRVLIAQTSEKLKSSPKHTARNDPEAPHTLSVRARPLTQFNSSSNIVGMQDDDLPI